MSSAPPPRYAPETPRPAYAHRPGITPHPRTDRSGHSYGEPEPIPSAPLEGELPHLYRYGIDLYNEGYLWEAHEAWEALWRDSRRAPAERELCRGLIQCAAAALQAERGRRRGARSLGLRAKDHLAAARARAPGEPWDLDVGAFLAAWDVYLAQGPRGAAERPRIWLKSR